MCFSNLGDLCLEYCSVLGGISGNTQPYVPIFRGFLHTHAQARTHTFTFKYILISHTVCTHTFIHIYIYFPHYFQLKGQGQKTSVFRFESVRLQGDEGYNADSQNFLLQLKGNFLLLLWESMDKWDERTKEDKMIA